MTISNDDFTFSTEDQYLIFFINDDAFAVNLKEIIQVIKYIKPSKLPQTSKFIAGIIPFRGEVVPVMDLRGDKKFIPNDYSIILVLTINNKLTGIIADSIYKIIKIDPNNIKEGKEFTNTKYIKGISPVDGMGVLILDFTNVENIDTLSSLLERSNQIKNNKMEKHV